MENNLSLVSIVIPVFNSREFLSEAIEAARKQTYDKIEILIIDNKSTDGSSAIAKDYSGKYENFHYLIEDKQGVSYARNKGIHEASGEWIQFLDADDIILPGKLQHQTELIEKNEDAGLIIAPYFFENEEGIRTEQRVNEDIMMALLDNKGYGQTTANLWKRSELLRVNGFNENLRVYTDPDLIFRMVSSGTKVVFDTGSNAVYRDINTESLTKTLSSQDLYDGYILSCDIYHYAIENTPVDGLRKTQLSNLLLKRIRMLAEVDLDRACDAFEQHRKIIPFLSGRKSAYGPNIIYLITLKLFGFRLAEKITRLKQKLFIS